MISQNDFEKLCLQLTFCFILLFTAYFAISPVVLADSGKTLERHFVAFRFKSNTSKPKIKEITDALYALKVKISQVISIEYGANNSPENLNKGFTNGFLITFANQKDRDVYLKHPEHEKFKKMMKPFVEEAFVFDYTTNNEDQSGTNGAAKGVQRHVHFGDIK